MITRITTAALALVALGVVPAAAALTTSPSSALSTSARVADASRAFVFAKNGSDDGAGHDAGDDKGGSKAHAETGDDKGGTKAYAEAGDDKGSTKAHAEAGDDKGGRKVRREGDHGAGHK